MAKKSTKTRAKSNTTALLNLHLTTLCIHTLFLASHLLIRPRSLTPYILLTIPSLICQYILERTGRPKYHPVDHTLVSPGDDLNNEGLTAYMFDVVWVTWGCIVMVMMFGNWGWWLWAIVPAFGIYKGARLFGMVRSMAGMGGMGQQEGGDDVGMGGAQGGAVNRKQRRAA